MNVRIDATEVVRALDAVQATVECDDRALMAYGASLLMLEAQRAFAAGVDPATNRPWPTRKGAYPWQVLRRTGTLYNALETGWGIKTSEKSGRRPKLFGKIAHEYYSSEFRMSGGKQQRKPVAVVGMVQYYGRGNSPKTKSSYRTPPRPFFGMSNSASRRWASRAEKLIEKINRTGGM